MPRNLPLDVRVKVGANLEWFNMRITDQVEYLFDQVADEAQDALTQATRERVEAERDGI